MRIGLISDIHANHIALEAVLLALRDVDLILCAGDLIGYYFKPNIVIRTILEYKVKFIIGNHDRYIIQPPLHPNQILQRSIEMTKAALYPEYMALLSGKAPEMNLVMDGIQIAMFHGSPWDPLEEYVYPDYPHFDRFATIDADIIILGHTHRPFEQCAASRIILNPGSVGQPRDGDPRAACAVLDTKKKEVKFIRVAYDPSEIINAISTSDIDNKLSSYLSP